MQTQQYQIAVQGHAIMTLTALTKNAILTSINVVQIPTTLIGPSAARRYHVLLGRVTVTKIQNVKVHLRVAMTIVQMDHKIWTAVGMSFVFILYSAMDGHIY